MRHSTGRRHTTRLTAVVVALTAALALTTSSWSTAPADAANGQAFDPGHIISDEKFFDGNALSAPAIQSFINAVNPGCAVGRICLRNYTETTTNKPPTTRCAAYTGASNESAAQIIYKVGKACGISQKAILVILQKEQSLVTSTAPSSRAFQAAMGAGCPDTAPCDGNYAGFFEQVYYGASLLKGYTIPGSTHYNRYAAGAVSNVLFHPDSKRGCGSAPVFIRNQATHALYVYTPYQPNAAALSNLYGTGDSCSSYGNRNFWRMYTDWFGPTGTSVGYSQIEAFYIAQGGADGWLGSATSPINAYIMNGGGLVQGFENGAIVWTAVGGPVTISGDIRAYFGNQGGLTGALGWPWSSPTEFEVNGGGTIQGFQFGAVLQTDDGVFSLREPLRSGYGAVGSISGPLGWPTSEATLGTQGSRIQHFQGGSLIWRPDRGAIAVTTPFLDYLDDNGGLEGPLGWPLANSNTVAVNGGGVIQAFDGGALTLTEAHGVILVTGRPRAALGALGGIAGPLGWPTGEAEWLSSHELWKQPYTGGVLVTDDTRHGFVDNTFFDTWLERGDDGPLGWPVTGVSTISTNGGGKVQGFQGGALTLNADGAVHEISGALRSAYGAHGGIVGPLGLPTSEAYADSVTGVHAQDFQFGTLYTEGKRSGWVGSNFIATYGDAGGVNGSLGWPTGSVSSLTHHGGGQVQGFSGGALAWSPGNGAFAVTGELRAALGLNGGIAGPLGWPVGNAQAPVGGVHSQQFIGGTLKWSAANGSWIE